MWYCVDSDVDVLVVLLVSELLMGCSVFVEMLLMVSCLIVWVSVVCVLFEVKDWFKVCGYWWD